MYRHVLLISDETEILAIGEDANNISYYQEGDKKTIRINIWKLGTNEAADHAFAVLSEDAFITLNVLGSPDWDT